MKAISPVTSLNSSIHVPGSKSLTQRALIAASLASGTSHIKDALISEDTQHLMNALGQLGADIVREGTRITVLGTGGRLLVPKSPLYMGNNGTGLRLLTGIVALGAGVFVIDGNDRMRQRPIQPLVDALCRMGVKARCINNNGCPPVEIHAQGLRGGNTVLDSQLSSQYVSALLLSAPYASSGIQIKLAGPLPSKPYVRMTVEVMSHFGVTVTVNGNWESFLVEAPNSYRACDYSVEGDASSATYFMAAAAICGGSVRIDNVGADSSQGDIRFLEILENMGCTIRPTGSAVEVVGPMAHHADLDFELGDVPDLVPALAVVSAFRRGTTVLKNIAHLRVKECDRVAALTRELRKLGVTVEEVSDRMVIKGPVLRGAQIDCYDDHRIAMSFAVAGLAQSGIIIKDPACVKKSFPDFWEKFESL